MPPPTTTQYTPTEVYEVASISEGLMAKTTRSGKIMVRQILKAYERESSVCRVLATELKSVRKRTLEEEESTTLKRLKKQDDKRSWVAREVLIERGCTSEEADLLLGAQPDRSLIYQVE